MGQYSPEEIGFIDKFSKDECTLHQHCGQAKKGKRAVVQGAFVPYEFDISEEPDTLFLSMSPALVPTSSSEVSAVALLVMCQAIVLEQIDRNNHRCRQN